MEEAEITYEVVIINSTMIYYYRENLACFRISSDTLWELRGNHCRIWKYISNFPWSIGID